MIWLRSLLFNVAFFAWTTGCLLVYWVFLPFPRWAMQGAVRFWARGVMGLMAGILGLGYRIVGREHLPEGPAIIACKHQSLWETAVFYLLLRDPVYVLKKELMRIPLWGWYATKAKMVAVDRSAGASALRGMVHGVERALAAGSTVIIFPEGTRTAPGVTLPYHPGVAALDRIEGVPVVPAALNSGLFWGRRSFRKYPGVITLEFLPPVPKGMSRKAFMSELENRIETAAERLKEEGEREMKGKPRGGDAR